MLIQKPLKKGRKNITNQFISQKLSTNNRSGNPVIIVLFSGFLLLQSDLESAPKSVEKMQKVHNWLQSLPSNTLPITFRREKGEPRKRNNEQLDVYSRDTS
jgi:hypothetical protein